MRFANVISHKKIGVGLVALLASLSLTYAQRMDQKDQRGGESPRAAEPSRSVEPSRAPVERMPATVERVEHGSIRHADAQIVQRPPVEVRRNVDVHHDVVVHRDVEVDYNRTRFWHGFVFGARFRELPVGCLSIMVGGSPYYYDDGIYYQQSSDGYQEVYPPVGADVSQPPDGAIVVYAGNVAYYYAGGAFYVEQNGGYVIAPTPIGVTVPELPPGAVQVSLNGAVAYQFNGIYYQPVFVDGVTQYMTIQA